MDYIYGFLFLFSLACLIIGLINPKCFSGFFKGDITRKKIALIFGVGAFVFTILFVSTPQFQEGYKRGYEREIARQAADRSVTPGPETSQIPEEEPVTEEPEPTQEPTPPPVVPKFNMADKDITTNGNVPIAVEKLKKLSPAALWANARQKPVSHITKKIYSSIGKLWKIEGEVYKVEENPPQEGLSGHWTDVMVLAENANSPLGTTSIDFMYNGDSSNINSGDVIICAGFLAGSYESQNAMGGTVEGLVLVGNKFKKL